MFVDKPFTKENLDEIYKKCRELGQENKDELVDFQENYPGILNDDNLETVLNALREKSS